MEAELRRLFYERLITFGNAEGLNISFPDVDFDPGNDKIYLSVDTLPVSNLAISICGRASKTDWLIQVAVYSRDGTGELKPLAIVDKLRAAFPPVLTLSGTNDFKIIEPAGAFPPVADDGWSFIPVQFRIQAISNV